MKKLIRQTPGDMSFLFKAIWGLGNFGGGLIGGIMGAYQLIYYQNYLGLSPHLYSLAILLYTLWNAINDPIMGYVSDRSNGRHGRRVPFFRFSAPFCAISFVMLFLVPIKANPIVMFFWLFLSLFVFDLGFTVYYMMYVALLPEITEHENERADLQFSYQLFSFIGTIIGMILPGLIRPDFSNPASIHSFHINIIIVAVIGLFFMMLTAFFVKERPNLSKVKKNEESRNLLAFLRDTVEILRIKPVRMATIVTFLGRSYGALIGALLYYIAYFVLKMDTTVFTLTVMLPLGIGLPFMMIAQRKIGATKVLEWSLFGNAVALIIGCMMKGIPALVFFAFAGFCNSGINLTMNMLGFDCADYDEVQTGQRREGLIFGTFAFVNVFSFLFTAIIPYVLKFSGFITAEQNGGVDTMDQPLSAVWGIRGMAILCAVLLLIGWILVVRFPLRGKKLEEIRAQVLALHAKEEKA